MMSHNRLYILGTIVSVMIVIMVLLPSQWATANDSTPPPVEVRAQDDATAAPVLLPSATTTPTDLPPTFTRTPTSQGPALIEAINPDANVRSGAGLEFGILGKIQPGEQYFVRGKLAEWYQIEYPNSPTRIAWVHQSVVSIVGDANLVPDLSIEDAPTIDPELVARSETQLAATQTPGGFLTLTAQAEANPQGNPGLFTLTPEASTTLAQGERLPTFTFPAFTATNIPIDQLQRRVDVSTTTSNEPFAPAIPILGLIGLGIIGTLVGIFRRL